MKKWIFLIFLSVSAYFLYNLVHNTRLLLKSLGALFQNQPKIEHELGPVQPSVVTAAHNETSIVNRSELIQKNNYQPQEGSNKLPEQAIGETRVPANDAPTDSPSGTDLEVFNHILERANLLLNKIDLSRPIAIINENMDGIGICETTVDKCLFSNETLNYPNEENPSNEYSDKQKIKCLSYPINCNDKFIGTPYVPLTHDEIENLIHQLGH